MSKPLLLAMVSIVVVLAVAICYVLVLDYLAGKKTFCAERAEQVSSLLSTPPPDTLIAQSEHRQSLELWKELFMRANDVSEEMFDTHIREVKAWEKSVRDQPYMAVEYSVILNDWASFQLQDSFYLDGSFDDILSRFTGEFAPLVDQERGLPNYNQLTDLRMVMAEPDALVDCQSIEGLMREVNPDFDEWHIYPENDDLLLKASSGCEGIKAVFSLSHGTLLSQDRQTCFYN